MIHSTSIIKMIVALYILFDPLLVYFCCYAILMCLLLGDLHYTL